MRADFHNEATERAKRALARDNARAMKEEQRLAEEELEEMENERKRREEELIRQQRRRLARLQEEQEERRQRMADEAEEEEAAIRRIAAGARAKLLTIEQMNEEMEESEGGESESHLPSEPEVGAIDKVTAYVGELAQFRNHSDHQSERPEGEVNGSADDQPERQNPRGGGGGGGG